MVDAIEWAWVLWLCHLKWLSEWSNESAYNFALSLNIPPWKLFGWFRRLQLWVTGDWQLHNDNTPTHASHLVQFLGKTSIYPGDSALHSPDLVPNGFWLLQKLKSPSKVKRLQTIDEIKENIMEQLMEIGRIMWGPKVTIWRGLRSLCPVYNVSIILYLLQ